MNTLFLRPALPLAIVVCLLSYNQVKADEPISVVGIFDANGKDADGTAYTSRVEIKKNGDTFIVSWSKDGVVAFKGVGILTDKVLSVSWVGASSAGVMVYKIEKGPKLIGRWALIGGKGTIQTETLTPTKTD